MTTTAFSSPSKIGRKDGVPPPLMLSLLPREILHSVLSRYCDCQSLALFWLSISCHQPCMNSIYNLLNDVVDERRRLYQTTTERRHNDDRNNDKERERVFSCLPPLSSTTTVVPSSNNHHHHQQQPYHYHRSIQTRLLSHHLMALDYCERMRDVIWCGYMEFNDPMLPDWSAEHASVLLVANSNDSNDGGAWSLENMHSWSSCFPIQAKLVSRTYNFIPIGPRAQIQGVSEQDKETIRIVRRRLEARDQVMTLRFPNEDGFVLRIISPEQAKRRLASFFQQRQHFESFPEGLLCSWEYPSELETPTPKDKLFQSIVRTLWNYRRAMSISERRAS